MAPSKTNIFRVKNGNNVNVSINGPFVCLHASCLINGRSHFQDRKRYRHLLILIPQNGVALDSTSIIQCLKWLLVILSWEPLFTLDHGTDCACVCARAFTWCLYICVDISTSLCFTHGRGSFVTSSAHSHCWHSTASMIDDTAKHTHATAVCVCVWVGVCSYFLGIFNFHLCLWMFFSREIVCVYLGFLLLCLCEFVLTWIYFCRFFFLNVMRICVFMYICPLCMDV